MRPSLREIPLDFTEIVKPGTASITMNQGQWDAVLATAYDMGWALIEVDDDEKPIAAYRK